MISTLTRIIVMALLIGSRATLAFGQGETVEPAVAYRQDALQIYFDRCGGDPDGRDGRMAQIHWDNLTELGYQPSEIYSIAHAIPQDCRYATFLAAIMATGRAGTWEMVELEAETRAEEGGEAAARRILDTYHALQGTALTEARLDSGLPVAMRLLEQGCTEQELTRIMLLAMRAGSTDGPFEDTIPPAVAIVEAATAIAAAEAAAAQEAADQPPEAADPPPEVEAPAAESGDPGMARVRARARRSTPGAVKRREEDRAPVEVPNEEPREIASEQPAVIEDAPVVSEEDQLTMRVRRARAERAVLLGIPRVGLGFTFGIGGTAALGEDTPGDLAKVQGELVSFELRLFAHHALSIDLQWNWFQALLYGIADQWSQFEQHVYAHFHVRKGPRNEFVFAPGFGNSLTLDVVGDPVRGNLSGMVRIGGEVSNPRKTFTYGVYCRVRAGYTAQWLYSSGDPYEWFEPEVMLEMTWIWYPRPQPPSL